MFFSLRVLISSILKRVMNFFICCDSLYIFFIHQVCAPAQCPVSAVSEPQTFVPRTSCLDSKHLQLQEREAWDEAPPPRITDEERKPHVPPTTTSYYHYYRYYY
jgi:hypothetical protein